MRVLVRFAGLDRPEWMPRSALGDDPILAYALRLARQCPTLWACSQRGCAQLVL